MTKEEKQTREDKEKLIQAWYEKGKKDGREALQAELRDLLGLNKELDRIWDAISEREFKANG